jgi:hypothetical protein
MFWGVGIKGRTVIGLLVVGIVLYYCSQSVTKGPTTRITKVLPQYLLTRVPRESQGIHK